MISRIWHGWTTPANADTYESLLRTEIFEGIKNRDIAGFLEIDLLRRDHRTQWSSSRSCGSSRSTRFGRSPERTTKSPSSPRPRGLSESLRCAIGAL